MTWHHIGKSGVPVWLFVFLGKVGTDGKQNMNGEPSEYPLLDRIFVIEPYITSSVNVKMEGE